MPSNNDLSEDELTRNDDDNNADRVKGEDESELSTMSSPVLSAMGRQLANTIPDSQEDTMTVISEAQSYSSTEIRLRQSEADLLKQKSYCVTLENRISELERRNFHLDQCIYNARPAQSFNGREAQLQEELTLSKKRLHREGLLMKSYKDLDADRLGFPNASLQAAYAKLESNVRDVSSFICDLSFDNTLPEQRKGFTDLANNWAKRIGRDDLGSLLGHCEAAQISKQFVLASLMAAGIFELVLEDVFPAFLAADSPLLDQYRKHIEIESKHTILTTPNLLFFKGPS